MRIITLTLIGNRSENNSILYNNSKMYEQLVLIIGYLFFYAADLNEYKMINIALYSGKSQYQRRSHKSHVHNI